MEAWEAAGGLKSAFGCVSKVGGAVNTGIKIFNQGRTGSTVDKIALRVRMFGPPKQNDIAVRASNAIGNAFSRATGRR